ncbi:MAG TPA: hypothetical protein VHF91_08650 [Acidimicrobiales bacterium]|nr:hypothetical protein [Acidimicrobiales bacterium]
MITTLTRTDEDYLTPQAAAVPAPQGTKRRRRLQAGAAGLAVAGVLAAVATAMMSDARFSDRYVTDQLERQRITFRTVEALTPDERKSECVVQNAGKALTTGKQAECYANEFIGLHVQNIGRGKTYAELEDVRTGLLARIAAAQATGDSELPKLQKDLGDLTGQREAMFKAEMLRGALLSSFGFSTLGEKVGQAATVAYAAAGLIALLSVAGLVAAARTPRS